MKSKFKIISYFILVFILASIVLLISILIDFESTFTSIYGGIFVVFMLSLVIIIFVLELKNKIILIEFTKNQLKICRYFGIGKTLIFEDRFINGYHDSIVYTRNGSYEYIYIMQDNTKIIKVSNQYHKNYYELKSEIQKKYKYLGFVNSTFFTELKDFFN